MIIHTCVIAHNTRHNSALYLAYVGDSLHMSLIQKVSLCEMCGIGSLALPCPALPCPALPCPALPCPALPCPARVKDHTCPALDVKSVRSTPTLIVLSAVSWTWSRVGGNGPAPPLHPSRALRPCQNTQSTQQTSLMAATTWSRVQVRTPMLLSSGAASGTTTRRSTLMSLPNSGCARMQSRQ